MSLDVGTRLGPYEIVAMLGAGGMGEVYKAKDTRLDRSVAIKVLPREVSADPDRRARFEREAKTIAQLSHPHICPLFDVGEAVATDPQSLAPGSSPVSYLVMEHLTGETLAQRLERGPLPLDQALTVGTEIADGLSAAHRQGVIHRDLKPANVMLTKTGAKLLDFGLAKLKAHGEQAAALLASAPTERTPLTAEGQIVGTLPYMAPEQVEGKEADARTDLWALGVILYEMVTGKRAFEGTSAASLITAIMNAEPPALATLQPLTPPAVDRLVRRCLRRDPDERWGTAHDVAEELRWIAQGGGDSVAAAGAIQARTPTSWLSRYGVWLLIAGLLTGASVVSAVMWQWRAAPQRLVLRYSLALKPAQGLGGSGIGYSFNAGGSRTAFTWTPEGRALVFAGVVDKVRRLYVRQLDQDVARPLDGTDGAQCPVVSLDSQSVAFWTTVAGAGVIRKVPLGGGASQTIVEDIVGVPRGMAWGPDDQILFGKNNCGPSVCDEKEGRIWLARGSGTPPTPVTELTAGELNHGLPQWLPGGQAFLYTVRNRAWTWGDEEVWVQSLATKERKVLITNATDGRYVPSGHLVFMRMGSLFAVRFDLAKLEVRGDPVALVSSVVQALTGGHSLELTGAGQFAVSPTGHLAYLPGPVVPYRDGRLVSIDRKGNVTPLPAAPVRPYMPWVRVSPDGRWLAVGTSGVSEYGLWLADLSRDGTLTNLTREGEFGAPIWTPDGTHIMLNWLSQGVSQIALQAADGSGAPESRRKDGFDPAEWTPDGQHVIGVKDGDIVEMDVGRPSEDLRSLVSGPAYEDCPSLSPDGRWLAYASNSSGSTEVYIQPYPGPGSRSQVSISGGVEGGSNPAWRADGRELFFISYPGGGRMRMMATAVDLSTTPPRLGTPQQLFEYAFMGFPLVCQGVRCYDVALDGQRFFGVKDEPREPTQPTTQVNVVLNWLEELKAKVPRQ